MAKNQELGLKGKGVERTKIKAIDSAAEVYVDLRDKMQKAVKKFKEEGKTPLIGLLHKNAAKIGKNAEGEVVYRYDDMEVRLTPKDEVLKVKHVEDEIEGDDVQVGAPKDKTEGEV